MFQILTPLDNFHLRLIDVYIFSPHASFLKVIKNIYNAQSKALLLFSRAFSSKVMISVLKDIHKAFINLPEATKNDFQNNQYSYCEWRKHFRRLYSHQTKISVRCKFISPDAFSNYLVMTFYFFFLKNSSHSCLPLAVINHLVHH